MAGDLKKHQDEQLQEEQLDNISGGGSARPYS